MITIQPFRGLRPRKDIVDKVAAKPYDVLNSQEAKEEAQHNPYSFLRISKPEIAFMKDSFVEDNNTNSSAALKAAITAQETGCARQPPGGSPPG